MKILYRCIEGLSIIAMLFFSIPKLTAQQRSVLGFTQFAEVLPVDPFLFMYITGAMEMLIAALLVAGLIAEWKKTDNYLMYASPLAFLFLLIMMGAALAIEFFVRPTPKLLLVVIALLLIAGSGVGLYHNRNLIKKMRCEC